MRSLSIGNSFSQDACAYLHSAAASAKTEWECINLYIGGCSLEYHAENLRENRENYTLEINGEDTGRKISVSKALCALGDFDFITLQQASHFSGIKETFFPFIRELYNACRKAQPNAEVVIHQTWAYEEDSTHEAFINYGSDQKRMYKCLCEAYAEAADSLGVRMISVGDTIQYLRENVAEYNRKNGGTPLTRDGYHLSIPDGRYIASLVWLETLAGIDARYVTFLPDKMTKSRRNTIAKIVHKYLRGG